MIDERNLTKVNYEKHNLWAIYRSNKSHINYQKIAINGIAQLTCSLNISPNCMNMPCNCWRASITNSVQRLFSDAINFCKNLAVRINISYLAGRTQKLTWHSLIVLGDRVRKIFLKTRVNVNSTDWICRANNGHASTAYNVLCINTRRRVTKLVIINTSWATCTSTDSDS